MKVLVTGMTPGQVASKRRRLRMFNIIEDSIVPTLLALGHEVDHRRVAADEEAGDYDLVVAGTTPLASIQTRNLIGGFTVLGWGLPTLLVFDDWRVREAATASRRVKKVGAESYFTRLGQQSNGSTDATFYNVPRETLERMAPTWGEIARQYVDGWLPNWYGLFPQHRFGNHGMAATSLPENGRDRLANFDPSAFMTRPRLFNSEKQPRWALATVQRYEWWYERLGLEWPVDVYGVRGSEYPSLPTEDDVAHTYAGYAGVLSPPHQHAGSGWFRTRYLHAAIGECVLWLDKKDRAMFDPSSAYHLDRHVERYDLADVRQIAEDQAEEFFDWLPFRGEEVERLGLIFQAVVSGSPLPDEVRVEKPAQSE